MSLVNRLRRMTGVAPDEYEIDGSAHWSDAHLQKALDARVSARLLQVPVYPLATLDEGDVRFVHGQASRFAGTLDTATVEVVDFTGHAIDGDVTVHEDGSVEFEFDQGAASPLLSGTAYDLNGAAYDVLTAWAAALVRGYDVSMDGQKLARSQRHKQLLQQASEFRAKALPGTVRLVRGDVAPRRRGRLARRLGPWFDQWGR